MSEPPCTVYEADQILLYEKKFCAGTKKSPSCKVSSFKCVKSKVATSNKININNIEIIPLYS